MRLKLKIEKTQGMVDYWFYFVRIKKLEGWKFYNHADYISTYLYKGDKKILYTNFNNIIKVYYKEVSTLLIKGHKLRFDFGLGNLRVIKTDRTIEQINKVARHVMLDKNTVDCCFYFSKDTVDYYRKINYNIVIKNTNRFKLYIARSNDSYDKSLGLKFRLRETTRLNPIITEIYDLKIYNNKKDIII